MMLTCLRYIKQSIFSYSTTTYWFVWVARSLSTLTMSLARDVASKTVFHVCPSTPIFPDKKVILHCVIFLQCSCRSLIVGASHTLSIDKMSFTIPEESALIMGRKYSLTP